MLDCRLGLGGVGGSRPCISMNLLVSSAWHGFFGVGIVGGHGFVIFFAVGATSMDKCILTIIAGCLPK